MIQTNKNNTPKRLVKLCTLIGLSLLLTACTKQVANEVDTITFEGTEYVFLEYPANEFYYDYNGNSQDNFEEADGIYPLESPKWDMIWNGGDLYCVKDSIDEANRYYADDHNYDWYVVFDTEEEWEPYPIEMEEAELDAIYHLEEKEKNTSVFWEEFEELGSIVKISKDGIVCGTMSIVKFEGNWYWNSEIIDESREDDGTWPEYVQELPGSLNKKIETTRKNIG